jgi:hypothetical protein
MSVMVGWDPRSVVMADIAESSRRDAERQRQMRRDLADIRDDVLGESLDVRQISPEDTGDGFRLLLPNSAVRHTRVISTFVTGLDAALKRYNSGSANQYHRMRLRLCFDFGLVRSRNGGWEGTALVRAKRLIDAASLRDALAVNTGADLVAIVSRQLYELVVQEGAEIYSPDKYQETRVSEKGFDDRAWLLFP